MALMAEDVGALARKFSQPLLARTPKDWSSRILNSAHEEALFSYGEYGIFTLMWRPNDFEAGLVGRCPTCFTGAKARQAEAFQQPTQRECPNCFGTTFEGGFRAQIIRPMLMADRNAIDANQRQGTVGTDTIGVETTSDFTFNLGDYVIRADNTRFQFDPDAETVIRTGFDAPRGVESLANHGTLHMEAETSVAYLLPPTDPAAVKGLLDKPGPFTVEDIETLNLTVRPGGYV